MPEVMISLRMWLENHRVAASRDDNIKVIPKAEVAIDRGAGPRNTGGSLG